MSRSTSSPDRKTLVVDEVDHYPGTLNVHVAAEVLFDVSLAACGHGIMERVVLSRAAWDECVGVPNPVSHLQDENGRLANLLTALMSLAGDATRWNQEFVVYVQNTPDSEPEAKHLIASPSDFESGERAILISLRMEWDDWSTI